MNKNSVHSRYHRLLAPAIAGCASILALAPAFAQGRVPIGLSARYGQLWLEEGSYPFSPQGGDLFGTALAVGDFNHDGFDDLAAGVPHNDCTPTSPRCGAVQVRLGALSGALTSRLILAPSANPLDPARPEERYGTALAAGDFNGDGYSDLAVGVPQNWVTRSDGSEVQGGAVQLHYGQAAPATALQAVAEYSFSQAADAGLPGVAFPFEGFGSAVAFGDFNGDGKEELAAGIPYDRVPIAGGLTAGGSVMVIGLDGDGAPTAYPMYLGTQGLPASPVDQDRYGYAVATGDFDGDGFDDLATGIPGRNGEGAVLVVYGSVFSLLFAEHQYFDQGSFGELPEIGDDFGKVLAVGDFNHDGYDDLAMGAPGEDGAGSDQVNCGQVIVSYGSSARLLPDGAPWLSESGIFGGGSELEDRFGSGIAAGDFDADGYDDLVVGAGGEGNPIGGAGSGAAIVLRGGFLGLLGRPARQLRPHEQPVGLIPQRPNESDEFAGYGEALAAGDFDGNGFDDLAIGAPGRSLGASLFVGAVGVVYGQLFLDGFDSGDALEWTAVAP